MKCYFLAFCKQSRYYKLISIIIFAYCVKYLKISHTIQMEIKNQLFYKTANSNISKEIKNNLFDISLNFFGRSKHLNGNEKNES